MVRVVGRRGDRMAGEAMVAIGQCDGAAWTSQSGCLTGANVLADGCNIQDLILVGSGRKVCNGLKEYSEARVAYEGHPRGHTCANPESMRRQSLMAQIDGCQLITPEIPISNVSLLNVIISPVFGGTPTVISGVHDARLRGDAVIL